MKSPIDVLDRKLRAERAKNVMLRAEIRKLYRDFDRERLRPSYLVIVAALEDKLREAMDKLAAAECVLQRRTGIDRAKTKPRRKK